MLVNQKGGDFIDVCLLPPLRAHDLILTLGIFMKNGLVKKHLRRSPFLGGNVFSFFFSKPFFSFSQWLTFKLFGDLHVS